MKCSIERGFEHAIVIRSKTYDSNTCLAKGSSMTNPRSFAIIDASNVIKYIFNDAVQLREWTGTKAELAKYHDMNLCGYTEGCDSMIAHELTNMNSSYCKPCKYIYTIGHVG